MKCKNCGNESDNPFGNGEFCCNSCLRSYIARSRHKNGEYKNHLESLHQKKRAPYGTWKCSICGEIFSSRKILTEHRKELSHYKLKPGGGGLKGLTKETSDVARKISETLKEKYKNGEIYNYWTGKHLSNKHREKISTGRIRTIDTSFKCGRRLDVKWYKVQNIKGQEFIVRGHWEEQVAIQLNKVGILWDRGKYLTYKTDIIHKYIPDFHVVDTNKYIEVKGYFPDEDFQKMKLTIEQHPEIELYCIDSKKYKDFITGQISLEECRFA